MKSPMDTNAVSAGPIDKATQLAGHKPPEPYKPKNKVRIVTAASLFDGHDAAINIMRRIIQASGAEVIHLGHDRSVDEVVQCAVQEDANAIAMTSYQGGHVEYLKYMHDRLEELGRGEIRIFAGGGGVILPSEIADLEAYGIERIYSPEGHAITLSAYGGGAAAKTGAYLVDGRVRKLHPEECRRLMGFPDGYKVDPRANQAYKQFGNAVVADVIEAVGREVLACLG